MPHQPAMGLPEYCAGGAVIRILIVLGILVAIGATGVDSMYQVAPGEVVMVSRLGRHQRTVQHPGLHFKLPFAEEVQHIGPAIETTPETHTLQRENRYLAHNKVKIQLKYIATWQVIDPPRYALTVAGDARRAEARVAQMAELRLRDLFSRLSHEQAMALLPGTADLATPSPLGSDLLEQVNPVLHQLGIEIVRWRLEQSATSGN